MMHKTLTTTDSMYGNLNGESVRNVITSLGQKKETKSRSQGMWCGWLKYSRLC